MVRITKLQLVLILILISITGIYLRLLPILFNSYSLYPGGFGPYAIYNWLHVVETGHLLTRGEEHYLTRFSCGINGVIPLKGYNLLGAIIYIILGFKDISEFMYLYTFLPIIGNLYLPMIVIALLAMLRKINKDYYRNNENKYLYDLVLLYMLAVFPSFTIITLTSYFLTVAPMGYLLLLIIFYSILNRNINRNYRIYICIFLCSILLPVFYHTATIVYFVITISILILQFIMRKNIININYLLFIIIYVVVYMIYSAREMFNMTIVNVVRTIINYFINNQELTNVETPLHSISPIPLWWVGINVIHGLLILTILIIHIYITIKDWKKNNYNSNSIILMYLSISAFSLAGAFFIWRGIRGALVRMDQYATIIALALVPFLLIKLTNKWSKMLKIITIIIILTSIVAYITNENGHYMQYFAHISIQEEKSILWSSNYVNRDNFLFSDFRLATVPIIFGYINVTGIIGGFDRQYIYPIYYDTTNTTGIKIISEKYHSTYILFTKSMTKKIPGIVGWGYQFPPAPENFLNKYFMLSNTIYNNNYTVIFKL